LKNSKLPFLALFVLLAVALAVGCSNPASGSTNGILQAGTTKRTNVAGDDYQFSISGYYTYSGQTAHLGTLSGTCEIFYTLDPTKGANIIKQTLIMTINFSNGQTSTQTNSTWYTASGDLYWDSTHGKVTSIVGNNPIYSANASWVVGITYADGVSMTYTYHVLGAYDVTCPYGIVKGAWYTQITGSDGSVSYAYYAPSIGSFASLSIASGDSSYTLYPTLLLSSYSLGS
jgi:hypothetical protein